MVNSRHRSINPIAIPIMRTRKAEKQLPTESGFPLKRYYKVIEVNKSRFGTLKECFSKFL